MKPTKEIEELMKEFEEKFGFTVYEEIKKILYTFYRKIEDLQKSRENWKNKYLGTIKSRTK